MVFSGIPKVVIELVPLGAGYVSAIYARGFAGARNDPDVCKMIDPPSCLLLVTIARRDIPSASAVDLGLRNVQFTRARTSAPSTPSRESVIST
jgi:hypothetical protein